MLSRRIAQSAFAIASALWLLSACGGGDDDIFETRGAIAVSETTGFASIIWGAASQNIANDEARSRCGGGDCKVVLQFSQCGALSIDPTLGIYAVAEGGSAAGAQDTANQDCRAKGGQACSAPPELHARCN